MQVTYSLEPSDYWHFQHYVCANRNRSRVPATFLVWIGAVLGGYLVAAAIARTAGNGYSVDWSSFNLGVLLVAVILFSAGAWNQRLIKRRLAPLPDGPTLAERTLSVSHGGIEDIGRNFSSRHAWSAVRSIDETDDYIFVMVDAAVAYIVPKRVFGSEDDCRAFVSEVKSALTMLEADRS